jgi:hypothetical protein
MESTSANHVHTPDACLVVCLATLLAVVLVLVCCWAQMKTTKAGFGAVTHNQVVLATLIRPHLNAAEAGLHTFGMDGVEADNQFKRTNPIGKVLPGSLSPSSLRNPLVSPKDPNYNVRFSGELATSGAATLEDDRIFAEQANAARLVLSSAYHADDTTPRSPLATKVANFFGITPSSAAPSQPESLASKVSNIFNIAA